MTPFYPRTGSLIIDIEVKFNAPRLETLASLEEAFLQAINGSLLGYIAEVRLTGTLLFLP